MRTLASTVLAFAVLATPTTLVTTTPAGAIECPPYASEEMKRPGGYCDQLNDKSLSGPVTDNNSDCVLETTLLLPEEFFQIRGMVVMVATIDPCQPPPP